MKTAALQKVLRELLTKMLMRNIKKNSLNHLYQNEQTARLSECCLRDVKKRSLFPQSKFWIQVNPKKSKIYQIINSKKELINRADTKE